jgi:hypothetical protein
MADDNGPTHSTSPAAVSAATPFALDGLSDALIQTLAAVLDAMPEAQRRELLATRKTGPAQAQHEH